MCALQTEEKEEEEEEALVGEVKASPNADTTILFVKGDGESSLPLCTAEFRLSSSKTLRPNLALGPEFDPYCLV